MATDDDDWEAYRDRLASKNGPYVDVDCPNCTRHRVMLGDDGKRRCEKCAWCIEDADYDPDLVGR